MSCITGHNPKPAGPEHGGEPGAEGKVLEANSDLHVKTTYSGAMQLFRGANG